MKLKKVRVHDFRCVDDSEEFSVGDVTCLVGKNESGKTALLKALHKLNPADDDEEFEASRDYPKRKWRPSMEIPEHPPAVWTQWELEDEDVAAIEKSLGLGVITDRVVSVSKGYENTTYYEIATDHAALTKHLIATAGVTGDARKRLSPAKTPSGLKELLEQLTNKTPEQERLLATLKKAFASGDDDDPVIAAVAGRLPKFLYFDEYLTLPGRVSVDTLKRRKQESKLEDRDRVFLALLALAGTDLDEIHGADTFEVFNSALRAVSNQITDQIFQYWTQNTYLNVDIRLDTARPNDPAPFNSGWVFRIRIDNTRHRADTSFDDRSRGFVWFFSFLVWFYQLRETYGNNLIILLDEPGLSLHARAQADLLRYIKEQLRPHYQVLYTTHSPFMIDPDNVLSARTVEDVVLMEGGRERLLGTKVGEQVLSADPDTVSPLQRALDYELTQTLFIGKHTLLVEGPSDFLYLQWFSRQLVKAGKEGLDYRWNICVVGGVDRIPGFVSLFRANGLNLGAVVDVQKNHGQRIERAREALGDGRLFAASAYADGQKEADIEDVLGREFYCALCTTALDLRPPHALPTVKPKDAPERVAQEVGNFAATLPPHYKHFDHFVPADYLFQHGDEAASLPGIAGALERMGKLIADVNKLLGPRATR